MKILGFAALAGCLIAGPAAAERRVITPSGLPDATYPGMSLEAVAGRLASKCMDAGWTVTGQTANQVVCEIPQSGGRQFLQQLLLGNAYSTPPHSYMRVSLAQIGPDVRAQAVAWVELQMAFGQVRQTPYTDDGTKDGLTFFLESTGGMLPPGTRFPGTFVGFDERTEMRGHDATYVVTRVFPGQAGEAAGLQVGDRIIKANGHTFHDDNGFRHTLNGVALGARYPLLVERGTQQLTLTLVARERPSVGTPEYDRLRAFSLGTQTAAGPTPRP
jgi:hypothetical protein